MYFGGISPEYHIARIPTSLDRISLRCETIHFYVGKSFLLSGFFILDLQLNIYFCILNVLNISLLMLKFLKLFINI